MPVWIGEEGLVTAIKFRFATTLDRNQIVLHFNDQPYFVTPFSDDPPLYLWTLVNFLMFVQMLNENDYDTANTILSRIIWSLFIDLTSEKVQNFNNSDWTEEDMFLLMSYIMEFTRDRFASMFGDNAEQVIEFCNKQCNVCPMREFHGQQTEQGCYQLVLNRVPKKWSN